MDSAAPFVRHMLLCEDVRASASRPRKVNVYGLLSAIRPTGDAAEYPIRHSFCVYLALTEGRGAGEGRIAVVSADTELEIYLGQSHTLTFGPDPLKVLGAVFRIASCSFARPGLYWVEFRYNGSTIARQPLLVGEP